MYSASASIAFDVHLLTVFAVCAGVFAQPSCAIVASVGFAVQLLALAAVYAGVFARPSCAIVASVGFAVQLLALVAVYAGVFAQLSYPHAGMIVVGGSGESQKDPLPRAGAGPSGIPVARPKCCLFVANGLLPAIAGMFAQVGGSGESQFNPLPRRGVDSSGLPVAHRCCGLSVAKEIWYAAQRWLCSGLWANPELANAFTPGPF